MATDSPAPAGVTLAWCQVLASAPAAWGPPSVQDGAPWPRCRLLRPWASTASQNEPAQRAGVSEWAVAEISSVALWARVTSTGF